MQSKQRWTIHLGVVASYAVLTGILFLPVFPAFDSGIGVYGATGQKDGWQNVWMLWWMQRAMTTGQNPFFTTMLYYPTGVGLFWQTLNSPNGLFALPMTSLFNAVAAFNTVAMTTFIVSGSTMYLLARRLTGSSTAAWLAGLFFAFSPFHLTKLYDGQLELMSIQYFPLLVLWLIYGLDQGRWRYVWLASFLLILITLTSLYYGLFSLIYLAIYSLALCILRRRWAEGGRVALRSVLMVGPLLVILLPRLPRSPDTGLDDWQIRQVLHSATPLDLVLPSPHNPFWGAYIQRIQATMHPGTGAVNISLGLAVLVLAGLGMIWSWKQVRLWAALIGLLMILELGPYLVVNGRVTPVPLSFSLLNYLPGVRLGQRPNHFVAITSVLVSLLAAYGWRALEQRATPQRRRGLWIGTILIIGLDLAAMPVTAYEPQISLFYKQIAPDRPGAILELPFQPDESEPLIAQLVHRRPITGGYLARIPEYDFAHYTEGIRQFWQPSQDQGSILHANWPDAIVPALATYDIEYVVIHLDQPGAEELAPLRRILERQLKLVYRDNTLVAFQRPVDAEAVPILSLRQGWLQPEARAEKRWQWTGPTADIGISMPSTTEVQATLQFRMSTLRGSQPLHIYQQVGEDWHWLTTFRATPDQRTYALLLRLQPGDSLLRLATAGQRENDQTQRVLGLSFQDIQLVPNQP